MSSLTFYIGEKFCGKTNQIKNDIKFVSSFLKTNILIFDLENEYSELSELNVSKEEAVKIINLKGFYIGDSRVKINYALKNYSNGLLVMDNFDKISNDKLLDNLFCLLRNSEKRNVNIIIASENFGFLCNPNMSRYTTGAWIFKGKDDIRRKQDYFNCDIYQKIFNCDAVNMDEKHREFVKI